MQEGQCVMHGLQESAVWDVRVRLLACCWYGGERQDGLARTRRHMSLASALCIPGAHEAAEGFKGEKVRGMQDRPAEGRS